MWTVFASIPAKVWLFIIKAATYVLAALKLKQLGAKEAEAKQNKEILNKVGKANAIRQKVRNDASTGKRSDRLRKFDR